MSRFLVMLLILGLPFTACSAQPAPPNAQPADTLRLTFLDVGQGDAVLIQAPTGQNVLIDGGRYEDRTIEHLKATGVRSLDLVIATHADFDHINGLVEVVRYYEPRFYLDNAIPHTTLAYLELLQAVRDAGSRLLEPTARTINLGEVTLRILPPPNDESLGQNDNSVGVIVEYGDFRASLTGDSEAAEWNYWERLGVLEPVTAHKASHHGSENGDTPLAMSRLKPEIVVISVGEGNSYGHPTERALRLYQAIGAEVYRTDLQGTITIRAQEDGSYTVQTEREAVSEPQPAPPLSPTPPPPVPTPSNSSVVIQCILYNPDGQDEGNEVVTLLANGTTDVTGWWLEDEAEHRLDLSGVYEAGQSYAVGNSGEAMWNNDGDSAFLYTAQGQLIDTFSYSGSGVQACR